MPLRGAADVLPDGPARRLALGPCPWRAGARGASSPRGTAAVGVARAPAFPYEKADTGPMLPGEGLAERFEIERRAGSGGMGEVYKARDLGSGEAVAIKVLLEGHASARFAREAEGLSELHHPGIVRYVADGETARGELVRARGGLGGDDWSRR